MKKSVLRSFVSLVAVSASAANLTWILPESGSGNLLDSANWNGGATPTEADMLQFSSVGDYEVVLDADATAKSIVVRNGGPSFLLYPWTLSFVEGFIVTQSGEFTLGSGTLRVGGLTQFGTDATRVKVRLVGPTTQLEVAGADFGAQGTGHLVEIVEGAKVTALGNIAIGNFANACTTVVDGVGSEIRGTPAKTRLYVGGAGSNNRLTIQHGGYVEVPDGNWTYLYVGNDARAKYNDLVVTDAGTVLRTGEAYIGNNGFSNTVYVLDGGLYDCTNTLSMAARGGWGNRLMVTNATFNHLQAWRTTMNMNRGSGLEISGSEARGNFNFLNAYDGCSIRFLDGAVVTNCAHWNVGYTRGYGDTHLIVSNATIHAGYNINAGNFVDNCSIQVLDGGRIENPSFFFDIGSQVGATNNSMIVKGEGSYVSANRFRLGGLSSNCWARISQGGTLYSGSVEIGSGVQGIGNWLEVVDGGLLTGPKNSNVYFGRTNPPNGARESMLRVNNATVDMWSGDSTLHMRGNGRLRIEGTNTVVRIPKINCANAALEFIPPPEMRGREEAYITTRGAVSIGEEAVLRVLDAEKCALKGGGVFTLMVNTNQDFSGTFQTVEASPDVTVTQLARSIVVRVADRRGTTFLVR